MLCLCSYSAFAQPSVRQFTVADGLQTGQVRQIVELPNGQIFVATEGMFFLQNGQRFVPLACRLDSVMMLTDFGNHRCMWQGDSLLWLKDFYSVYLLDVRQRRFRYDYQERLRSKEVKLFVEGGNAAQDRLTRDLLDAQRPLFDSVAASVGLHDEVLMAFCRDRQGGRWMGTSSSGIVYLSPETHRVNVFQMHDDFVRRLVSVGDQRLLLGGERGIYEFDIQANAVVKTLARGNIHCNEMSKDAQGRVWVGTNEGVFFYADGRLTLYNSASVSGLLHNHVRFALPLDDGRVLVCCMRNTLGYLSPDTREVDTLNVRIPALEAYRTLVCAAPLGGDTREVLVLTQNGAFVLDTQRDTCRPFEAVAPALRYSSKYNCVLRDRAGRLWLGTQNGLLMLRQQPSAEGRKEWTMRRVTDADGLSNTCIQSLAEDPQGGIWVGTSWGINRMEADGDDALRIRWIGVSEGVPPTEMGERGVCMMADGRAYFATLQGLVSFATDHFSGRLEQPSVVLVGLSVGVEEMPTDRLSLQLSHRQNDLAFQFSALNYASPERTRYRYRLLGLDENYSYSSGAVADVRYFALRPGTYTLEVQASAGDGEWGPVLQRRVEIRPPLWLTWWAYVLYVLAGGGLLVWLLHLYLKRRQAKMERESEVRINKLFELREEALRQFAQNAGVEAAKVADKVETAKKEHAEQVDKMVERIMKYLGKNMDNPDYTVDLLARDIGMSRANLYKRMQAGLGITPNEFMRNVRLKRASQLLAETSIEPSRVGRLVGFQTPRYFNQCFVRLFGVTPKEYREGKGN